MELNLKPNKYKYFHKFNQGDEDITKYMCTVYAGFINAYYNGVIPRVKKGNVVSVDLTEDEIKIVAERCHKKGTLNYSSGGPLEDNFLEVVKYLREDRGIDCNYAIIRDDNELNEFIDKGYAIELGIKVGSKFVKDIVDYKIDTKDYKELKGNKGHATNIIRSSKDYILDSYMKKDSAYECDINEVLKHLDMPTKYVIFK